MISKQEADEIEARVEKDIELVRDLMSKFCIDPKKGNAYRKLSIVLARKHYPNGVKKIGRPINNYARFYAKQMKCGKLGRPSTRKKFRKELLRAVEGIIAEHGFKGRGSDKKALEILLEEFAIDTNKSKLRTRKKYLKAWQKDLSRARHT